MNCHFSIIMSILFFVHWISLFFFHIKFYQIMFIIVVFRLGCNRPSGLLLFVPAVLFSILTPLFCPSSYLIVLYRSCCSHAWVFGKTVVHEFPVSYSHTKWYFLISLFGAGEYKCPADTIIGFVPEVAVKNHQIKIKNYK